MCSNGACCLKFTRVLLIFFNGLFVLCSGLLMAVGIWLLVDPSSISHVSPFGTDDARNSSLLRNSAIILLSTGCLLFLICILGCIGAVMRKRIALGFYIGLLVVVFSTEVAGAVVAIAYKDWFLDNLDDLLRDSISENDPPYYGNINGTCISSTYGKLWDYFQVQFVCCGIHEEPHTGYELLTYSLQDICPDIVGMTNRPLSCCVPKQNIRIDASSVFKNGQENAQSSFDCSSIKQKGCMESLEQWVGYYSPVLIGVGFGVSMLQIIGFILAVCLCVNAPRHHPGYKRR